MSASTLAASNGLGVKCINAGRRDGVQIQCADLRARRRRALLWCHLAPDRRGAAAGGRGRSAFRIRCICIATISAFRAMSTTALATIEAARGEPLHLAHLQFYAYGERRRARLLVRRGRTRRGRQRRAECHRRCRPGHVPADRDDLVRRAAAVQRLPGCASPKKSVIYRRRWEWRRHRALPLSRDGFRQCRAMGVRARTVPADR